MARKYRLINHELIFYSDRGVQYACTEFKGFLEANPFVLRSKSPKGNCWDNAVAESFFKNVKTELVYKKKYGTKKQAIVSVFEYIETWYNTTRSHSALNYLSPGEVVQMMNKQKMAA